MKVHTPYFKDNICLFGRQLDTKISYTLNNESIELGSEDLNSVSPHYEGGILKSVMRQLDIDSNVSIPVDTEINCQFGCAIGEDENGIIYEYINMGNYVVYSVEKKEDTDSYMITCYDKMILSMVDYSSMSITYPITIRSYINAICTHLGLTFKNASDTFANYNKEIPAELYLTETGGSLGYTFRDVLDELAQVTASTICINEVDDELEIRYITDTDDTIDEEYLKDINVKFGNKFGPVNSIVLSRSGESDNVFLQDEDSVEANGLCEIKIVDNQIMNDNNRSDYLADILEQLDGLEYYENDFTSTGICYYNICDRYNVQIGNNTYSCVMFNDDIQITQGLKELIFTEIPEYSETEYKHASKTDRMVNQVYIIVKKNQAEIEATVSTVNTIDQRENNNYQQVINKFNDYTPTEDTLQLEQRVTQLQTDTYTKTEIDTKLVDGSVEKVMTTSGTFDENGLTIEKTDAKTKGNFNERGLSVMDATGSGNTELLFAGYDEDLNETIVRTKNIKVTKYLTIGQNSRIEDYENGTGIFYIG